MKKDCSTCVRGGVGGDLCLNCKSETYENFESKPNDTNVSANHIATKCRDPKAMYYSYGGVEVLDVIKGKMTPEQYKGWILWNLIKYACRANHKGQFARDIEKVNFYSKEMFNILEK